MMSPDITNWAQHAGWSCLAEAPSPIPPTPTPYAPAPRSGVGGGGGGDWGGGPSQLHPASVLHPIHEETSIKQRRTGTDTISSKSIQNPTRFRIINSTKLFARNPILIFPEAQKAQKEQKLNFCLVLVPVLRCFKFWGANFSGLPFTSFGSKPRDFDSCRMQLQKNGSKSLDDVAL